MRRFLAAALIAATAPAALTAPALAQSPSAQARWDQAQRDYQMAYDRFQAERQRYMDAVRYDRRYGRPYDAPPPPPPPPGGRDYAPPPPPQPAYDDDRYDPNYDAARYYRPGTEERVLSSDDRVYRGNDGRYYCKRSDGTTGLIIGAAGGGILGNVIDGGHSRAAGTLIGAAVGALAGRAIDKSQSEIKCR